MVDRDDRTRAFTKRLLTKTPNNYPNQAHASSYAITLHYLNRASLFPLLRSRWKDSRLALIGVHNVAM